MDQQERLSKQRFGTGSADVAAVAARQEPGGQSKKRQFGRAAADSTTPRWTQRDLPLKIMVSALASTHQTIARGKVKDCFTFIIAQSLMSSKNSDAGEEAVTRR